MRGSNHTEIMIREARRVVRFGAIGLNLLTAFFWITYAIAQVYPPRRLYDGGVQFAGKSRGRQVTLPNVEPRAVVRRTVAFASFPAFAALVAVAALIARPSIAVRGGVVTLSLVTAIWWLRLYVRVRWFPFLTYSLAPVAAVAALCFVRENHNFHQP